MGLTEFLYFLRRSIVYEKVKARGNIYDNSEQCTENGEVPDTWGRFPDIYGEIAQERNI